MHVIGDMGSKRRDVGSRDVTWRWGAEDGWGSRKQEYVEGWWKKTMYIPYF